jgi:hypothetical protein
MISAAVALVLILAILGVVVLVSRRGERSVDPPGVRSLATFRGAEATLTPGEREAEKKDGRGVLGRGLANELVLRLRERGLTVGTPVAEDYGYALALKQGRDTAHVLLGATEGGAEGALEWALSVLDEGGNPAPSAALTHVDGALREVPGVEGVAWHKRERHLVGDLSSAADHPLDDAGG